MTYQIPLVFLCSKWILIELKLSPCIFYLHKLRGEYGVDEEYGGGIQEEYGVDELLAGYCQLAGEREPLPGNHKMALGEIMFKCSFF